MIEISKTLPSYRQCNGCRGTEDVREIKVSFDMENYSVGTVIVLCKKCRKKLEEMLKEAERADDE